MRIAHVNVAREFRGGERQTELLIQQLHSLGLEQVLVARRGAALASRFAGSNIEIREVSGHLPSVFKATRSVDIVHVHEGRSIYAAWLRSRVSGTPYVATRRVNNPISDHWFAHRAYRDAAMIAAVAPQVADVVREFDSKIPTTVIMSSSSGLNVNPAEVSRIRAGIDAGFVVGHVGALDNDQKAQDTIIQAARSLRVSNPDIHFVLVGGGADAAMLQKLASDLDNLSFTGFVDNVGDYLATFDVFILPSRREGIGSILFDAMEAALPLIATPVGGVPRIVHDGENGILIGVDDPDALAGAILRLKSNPKLMADMGTVGKQMAKHHTPPQMAHSYLELYRSILGKSVVK